MAVDAALTVKVVAVSPADIVNTPLADIVLPALLPSTAQVTPCGAFVPTTCFCQEKIIAKTNIFL